MQYRQAEQQDAQTLARLIFDSSASLLTATFDITPQYSAFNFLVASLAEPDGQYGYKNHWVAVKDKQVIGCISAWHSKLSTEFHQATLKAITDFYGLEHALTVLHINQILQDCIPEIALNEWCIGHLSVCDIHQRQGIGKALIKLMYTQAIKHKKSLISLDVEAANQGAIDFYLTQGFSINTESAISHRMAESGVGAYKHLIKTVT
jgi:ribosomal protein S18 acetylase RimI-like enzyme